jgi:hypothetical protein
LKLRRKSSRVGVEALGDEGEGVVHQVIQPAVLLARGRHEGRAEFLVGEVPRHDERREARGGEGVPPLRHVRRQAADHDGRTLAQQLKSDGVTDAVRAAGDERDLARETGGERSASG